MNHPHNRLHIERLEEGWYLMTSPDLQGLVAQGPTLAETMDIAADIVQKLVESQAELDDEHLPVAGSRSLTIGVRGWETIYVGDSCNMRRRIKTHHCGNNSRQSALRRSVARSVGYDVANQQIQSPDRPGAEVRVSEYVKRGLWKLQAFDTREDAHDFQNYVIEKLNPCLNRQAGAWDHVRGQNYERLLEELLQSPDRQWDSLTQADSGPGVYVFLCDHLPTPLDESA